MCVGGLPYMLVTPYSYRIIVGNFGGGGQKFMVFVVSSLRSNILPTNEATIDYLYLQCKQQLRK